MTHTYARALTAIAFGLAVCSSHAPAQTVSTLTPPQRVRLSAPELALHQYRGTLSERIGDTLVVDDRRVALRQLTALAISTESHAQWRWGAVVGAAAGALWGGVVCRRSDCQEADLPVHLSVFTAAAGALVGVVIGAHVRTDRWRAISLGGQGVR